VEKFAAQRDDKENDGYFYDDDRRVEPRAFFDTDRENDSDDESDEEGGQVKPIS